MAFKDRISSLFRRVTPAAAQPSTPAAGPEQATTPPSHEAPDEERQELVRSLDTGVRQIGEALHHLDRHLVSSSETIERAARGLADLPALAQQLGQNVESNRQLVEALAEQLRQRDEAQAAIVGSMQRLAEGFEDQRRHDQQQVDLVLRLHNAGRRMAVLLLGLAFVGVLVLVCVLLAVILRPELIGLRRDAAISALPPPTSAPDTPSKPETPSADLNPGPPLRSEAEAEAATALPPPTSAPDTPSKPETPSADLHPGPPLRSEAEAAFGILAQIEQEQAQTRQLLRAELEVASRSSDPMVAARARQALDDWAF